MEAAWNSETLVSYTALYGIITQ